MANFTRQELGVLLSAGEEISQLRAEVKALKERTEVKAKQPANLLQFCGRPQRITGIGLKDIR